MNPSWQKWIAPLTKPPVQAALATLIVAYGGVLGFSLDGDQLTYIIGIAAALLAGSAAGGLLRKQ
jgi:hypothetical protein